MQVKVRRHLTALHLQAAQTESSVTGGCCGDVMEPRTEVQVRSQTTSKCPQNPTTVYQSLHEEVTKALNFDLRHYTSHTPGTKGDPGETAQGNRALCLTVEHIVLQVTQDMAAEVAHEFHNIAGICRALSFNLILKSTQQSAGWSPEEDTSALTHTILQQQLDRETSLTYRHSEPDLQTL
ncbi:hypothetical protein AGOR_G00171560 [Albula goreensis]|uniref:Uncharacterized protein n=1 Tax=Albula goreensis TaxID=1534307 RepID=A0A8T3CU07_9TELE|nr:hypothetical protein AGOR_G00171560 [Albula goreensis]